MARFCARPAVRIFSGPLAVTLVSVCVGVAVLPRGPRYGGCSLRIPQKTFPDDHQAGSQAACYSRPTADRSVAPTRGLPRGALRSHALAFAFSFPFSLPLPYFSSPRVSGSFSGRILHRRHVMYGKRKRAPGWRPRRKMRPGAATQEKCPLMATDKHPTFLPVATWCSFVNFHVRSSVTLAVCEAGNRAPTPDATPRSGRRERYLVSHIHIGGSLPAHMGDRSPPTSRYKLRDHAEGETPDRAIPFVRVRIISQLLAREAKRKMKPPSLDISYPWTFPQLRLRFILL